MSERVALALVKFQGGKGGGKQSNGNASGATEMQQQQKRDASKRMHILSKDDTPDYVKNKWEALCKLNGRNESKSKQKSEFTAMLLKDAGSWTDAYWQASVEQGLKKSHEQKGEWILRAKAEAEHGGGEAGKRAIDMAVTAGIYAERFQLCGKDKNGKPVRISQICVKSEVESQKITKELKEKLRVGSSEVTSEDFQNATKSLLGTMKRPAAALTDEDPPNSKKRASTEQGSEDNAEVMKKPASKMALSAEKVKKLEEEHIAQNDQLNKCIQVSVVMLQKQEMANRKANQSALASDLQDRKRKMLDFHLKELEGLTEEIMKRTDINKEIQISKTDMNFTDEKIDTLDVSQNLIQDSKDVIKALTQLVGKEGSEASASSAQ